jgi:serine/threonine protein kinase
MSTPAPASVSSTPDKLPSDSTPHRSPRALPLPGELAGPYRLVFELAAGGMATIYLALADRRAGVHQLVAVKRLHRHLAADPNYRKMFVDEARIASHLRHPNVCAVFDYDEREDVPYIVMEYLAGEPISAVWKALPRGGSPEEIRRRCVLSARIVADACEALHAAHELRSIYGEPMNVVHRDVSPENLIVTYDGVVKLCDFGIAIAERQEHETEVGMLKGKYAYIQPEALRGERPDRRSDVFSLGIVLWELMTGERLFRRESAVETLRAVSEAAVKAPSTVVGVCSEFDAAVMKALAPDPTERFQSAREFGKALDTALATIGCRSGLCERAEWMDELFPGGRAQNVQAIELMATLYDPARSLTVRQSDAADGDSEEATVAGPSTIPPASKVPPASTVPPAVSVSSLHSRNHSPTWRARWRPSLITFAIGALLGAQYLPSVKLNWRNPEAANATELSTKAATMSPPATAAEPPKADPPPTTERQTAESPVVATGTTADTPPAVADPESQTDTSSKAARAAERRKRSGRSGPKASTSKISPTLMAPARNLELDSEFAAYAPVRLPPSLLLPKRNASSPAAQ